MSADFLCVLPERSTLNTAGDLPFEWLFCCSMMACASSCLYALAASL